MHLIIMINFRVPKDLSLKALGLTPCLMGTKMPHLTLS